MLVGLCYKSRAMPGADADVGAAQGRATEPVKQAPENVMLYCPACSERLTPRKCKLICERCGYYMSCSDYV